MVPNMSGRGDNEDVRADLTQLDAPSDEETSTASSQEVESSAESAEVNVVSDTENTPNNVPSATETETTTTENADANAEAPAVTTAESGSGKKFQRGDLIEATIKATTPTSITIDLGDDREGVIPGGELERMNRQSIEELKVGASLTVYVVNPRDPNGNVVLSINRAIEELDWLRAEEFRQSQQVYESRIAGYNKGGLIVRFGRLRGFVPQSQMNADRRRVLDVSTGEEGLSGMVNEVVVVKVVEVDRARNRLILSERSASRESREKRKADLIEQLNVGEVREGRVVSLEDFGAFVDVGGAEGLVHLTELSWQHVTHPRELLEIGQTVKVEVISIDSDAKRIGLSLKRQASDPWDTIALGYQVGQLVQGEVTKLTKFGAFAKLVDVPEIEGLIHISELSDKRVNHPREVVKEGDRLTLRVVKIDVKNRRLGLSLKKVISAEYLDSDWGNQE